jgi:hypothetical protein
MAHEQSKYTSILEYEFANDFQGESAKRVVTEVEGVSNLLLDAPVMEANGRFEHIARRDNEICESAITLAYDDGLPTGDNTHMEEHSARMGRVGDGKEYSDIQERLSRDPQADELRQIQKTAQGLIRKDALMTIYGGTGSLVDAKGWNGLAFYTNKIWDSKALSDADAKIAACKTPFEGDNCICISNQMGSTSKRSSKSSKLAQAKYGSIFAVAWGQDGVMKIFPLGMAGTAGIETHVMPWQRVKYTDAATGRELNYMARFTGFDKYSGVFVQNRFSLMRLANIYLGWDVKSDEWEEEMEAVQYNMTLLEKYLTDAGMSNVKFYAPSELIRQLKVWRAEHTTQVNIYREATQANLGKPNGFIGEFVINDSVVLYPEFMLKTNESALA